MYFEFDDSKSGEFLGEDSNSKHEDQFDNIVSM